MIIYVKCKMPKCNVLTISIFWIIKQLILMDEKLLFYDYLSNFVKIWTLLLIKMNVVLHNFSYSSKNNLWGLHSIKLLSFRYLFKLKNL